MSFDGLFTRAMCHELAETLVGGRINKIHQPYKQEIVLLVRSKGQNYRLLLSAHPSYARVQLTKETYENPPEPPMFCMLLRKHLEGGIIEEISQHELDRMIIIRVKDRNEIGDVTKKQLIIEVMGRHSNIILVDEEKQMILDSIKHISYAVNRYRAVLPGQTYIFPPSQDKRNPLNAREDDVLQALDFNSGKVDKQIVQAFAGVSPLLAKEILWQAKLPNRSTVPKAFLPMMQRIRHHEYEPSIMYGQKESFYLFPLEHIQGETRSFSTLSEMLDAFYFGKAERDRVKQQAHDLERFIKNEKEKNEAKIEKLKQTLVDAQQADKYQLYGELLTANIYAIQKGMTEIEVVNYYDENGSTVTIPLDPQKTPAENAQRYFSKYQKARNAIKVVTEQIERAENEVAYFDRLLQQIETASPKDIEEIREELVEEGYLRPKQTKTVKKQKHQPVLEVYEASDGTEILVGKNNKQNDYLTNKVAKKDEIWLHTKDIPGSHVVIRSTEPSEETIIEAAMIAAYFSKGRESSSVPVDFTKVRYVKKPSGAKPGFVIYDHQQTVYVTPSKEKVLQMKKIK
jgi:predicted ribosome quality control (RQC) complex YloA/Tae2 family protein